ncbi:Glucose-methanol-choline oxidoreductase N-terminal domain-containing protein [Madurella fahalii]|uniref:Glucose-methanol-choline oxidoreductase N-terminal domain-containing protein n=1 Tax=Madurella fahalii TaxID=1157608 RepID=A0ABQ0GA85_9PEZI
MAARICYCLAAGLSLLASHVLALPDHSGGDGDNDVYDYIVVGSGPGGAPLASNLAKAGHSVLLLEAGDDQSADITTSILALGRATVANRWDFFVRQYSDDAKQLKNNHLTWQRADGSLWVGNGSAAPADANLLGVYYPRGATLGGSSVINAGVAVLPSRSDWDYIGRLTGDRSWNANTFRRLFQRIEDNHYVDPGTPGHGFDGYLDIVSNDGDVYVRSPSIVEVLESMVSSIGDNPADTLSMTTRDINNISPTRDTNQGLFGLPFHGNETWGRFSARDIILSTFAAKKPNGSPRYPLTLKTHSLVTRVLFDQPHHGRKPRATGVEYLQGQSLYRADPRHNSSSAGGTPRTAHARREVILSAGVFNTPQLLLLSGIGPRAHLEQHNIPLLADVPGVGTHLQDNPELPVVGVSANGQPFLTEAVAGDPACTFGAPTPAEDPCVEAWRDGRGEGPYARGGANSNAFLLRTNHSRRDGEVDVLVFSIANFAFRGYWPLEAASNIPPDPPGTFGMSLVKMDVQSAAGTVRLRSADPRDPPEINFEVLNGEGGEADVEALADAAAWARRVYAAVEAPVGPMVTTEPPCSGGNGCREVDKQWAREQAFGHHATSTCAIGNDGDPWAVLDSKFRVRGVLGLRVVDGSAFPKTPGSFPVIATFLLSEKASEDILDDAAREGRGRI